MTPPARTGVRALFRRLARNRAALVGGSVLLTFLVLAALAPWIAPRDPTRQILEARLRPPSWAFLLGTDDLGRDLLSRIIHGARISLFVGMASVGISLAVGTPVGAMAGYFGGRTDDLIMRGMDIILSFPSFLLAVLIVGSFGPSLNHAMVAIGIVRIPVYARLIRSSVLSVKAEAFVEAARALGVSDLRNLFRHVLPNCLAPVIVQATLGVASAILEAAGLSFLGLGAQPPAPEWGAMLAGGRAWILTAPWVVTFPGIAILLAVLGFNLLGDGLRDALDPRLRI